MFTDFNYEIARQHRQQLRRKACQFRLFRRATATTWLVDADG